MATKDDIANVLQEVMARHLEVEQAKHEEEEAERKRNSRECARSNAVTALATAIADLPEPVLRSLCSELDRAIPMSIRPQEFVVRKRD